MTADAGARAGTGPVLAVEDLTVRFGGRLALDGVTFSVAQGTILGIIGPNGAGKSTLFDAICGLATLERGQVRLGDDDITALTPHDRAARGLGRSFQDGRLFPSLSVAECVAIALSRHVPIEAPLSVVTGGPLARSNGRRADERANEILAEMGLTPYADAFVRELSTGTRRLVDLACAVAHAPQVLLLDEPSSGIAQAETDALASVLRRVRARTGCTMLLIEHDIPLVTSIADRLVALETGTVIADGRPAEVIEHPDVVAAYLGADQRADQRADGRADQHDGRDVEPAGEPAIDGAGVA